MNELARSLLLGIGSTTLFVAGVTLIFVVLLRVLRVASVGIQRAAWIVALAVGWIYVPVLVAIPWYKPIGYVAARADVGLPPGYAPLAVGAIAPVGGVPVSAAMQGERSADSAHVIENATAAAPGPSATRNWPVILAAAWGLGIVGIVGMFLSRYLRFMRAAAKGQDGDAAWQREWDAVLSRAGVRRSIPLRVAGEFGPALCRLPRGFVLFVPAELWRGLDAAQREAILVHELAHYRRGDVWKSLAARLAALPHWFNPLAWYAAERFEEAGEWACDEAVRRAVPENVTRYAQALLSLGEVTGPSHALSTAARGRELPVRVRRLLAGPMEDSKMKKFFVSTVAVLIVLVCAVRFELVAQDAQDKPAVINEGAVKHAEAMVAAAQTTFQAVREEYGVGRIGMESLYTWSRRWLDAKQLLADLKSGGNAERLAAERAVAFDMHLKRMEELHARVNELFVRGAQGGELGRLEATKFFVAEAKLWAEGVQDAPAVRELPANTTDRVPAGDDDTPDPPAAANATDAEALYAQSETLDDALTILKDQLSKNGLEKYAALLTKDSLNVAMAGSLRGIERDFDRAIKNPQNIALREKLSLQRSHYYELVRPVFHEIIKTGAWPSGSFFQFQATRPPNEAFSLELKMDLGGKGYASASGFPVRGFGVPLLTIGYGWLGPPADSSEADLDLVLFPGQTGVVYDIADP